MSELIENKELSVECSGRVKELARQLSEPIQVKLENNNMGNAKSTFRHMLCGIKEAEKSEIFENHHHHKLPNQSSLVKSNPQQSNRHLASTHCDEYSPSDQRFSHSSVENVPPDVIRIASDNEEDYGLESELSDVKSELESSEEISDSELEEYLNESDQHVCASDCEHIELGEELPSDSNEYEVNGVNELDEHNENKKGPGAFNESLHEPYNGNGPSTEDVNESGDGEEYSGDKVIMEDLDNEAEEYSGDDAEEEEYSDDVEEEYLGDEDEDEYLGGEAEEYSGDEVEEEYSGDEVEEEYTGDEEEEYSGDEVEEEYLGDEVEEEYSGDEVEEECSNDEELFYCTSACGTDCDSHHQLHICDSDSRCECEIKESHSKSLSGGNISSNDESTMPLRQGTKPGIQSRSTIKPTPMPRLKKETSIINDNDVMSELRNAIETRVKRSSSFLEPSNDSPYIVKTNSSARNNDSEASEQLKRLDVKERETRKRERRSRLQTIELKRESLLVELREGSRENDSNDNIDQTGS